MKNKFKFYNSVSSSLSKNFITELFFNEHIEEIRQRCFQSFGFFLLAILVSFLEIKGIVKILEAPVQNIHFFQSSPSEYFASTLKIAFYLGLVLSIPSFLSQGIFFLLPGLSNKEKDFVISLVFNSLLLFVFGLSFSYFVLIPAALQFFINYNLDIIDPLWSFDQYFNFILILFFSTSLIFQIPIGQVLLSVSGLVNGKQMLAQWKYVLLFATILGAVLTPSTDPFTQLLLSSAVFVLYLFGSYFAIFLTKPNLV